MPINVVGLTKEFRIPNKKPGLVGAVKHLLHGEYDVKRVVDNVSFQINDGDSVAYIGPNGAGKSTTIKMLTGILYPTSGIVEVNGINPFKERIVNAQNIGVVFGQRSQLWWDIPIEESFGLLKDLYDIPNNVYKENISLFTDIFGLDEFIKKPVRFISLGQKMRAELAAALLHNPAVLFLDEPTIGLDISAKENMRALIRKINEERGTTIVLTSHDLQDIEDLCRRVIVIDGGKLVLDTEVSKLKARFAHDRVMRLKMKNYSESFRKLSLSDLHIELTSETSADISFVESKYTAIEILQLLSGKAEVVDFELIEPDIKTVIKRIYQSDLQV